MKTFTLQDIRDKGPCYDPVRHWPEDWQGTLLDILDTDKCPAVDRIWVASMLLEDKTLRLFAVACARRALELYSTNPDTRSVEACTVAERFAHGQATQEELDAARDAAYAAAYAAYAAAGDAAYAAAYAAAGDAARDAACAAVYAARDADEAAAAARAAAWEAARGAACAARDAACAAARGARAAACAAARGATRGAAAEQRWQVEKLKQLIL